MNYPAQEPHENRRRGAVIVVLLIVIAFLGATTSQYDNLSKATSDSNDTQPFCNQAADRIGSALAITIVVSCTHFDKLFSV